MNRPLQVRPKIQPTRHTKAGQAILESFAVMLLLCLILFGVVQYVLMLTATEVIQYSADASVRARAVGFNRFMVYKVNRVASIPNAGIMVQPQQVRIGNAGTWTQKTASESYFHSIQINRRSSQYFTIEQYQIPLFLSSTRWGEMHHFLDYEDWDTISRPMYTMSSGDTIGVTVQQEFPLRMPFVRAFSDDHTLSIEQEARLADHAELYLE